VDDQGVELKMRLGASGHSWIAIASGIESKSHGTGSISITPGGDEATAAMRISGAVTIRGKARRFAAQQ
jgi:hypothetical protein